MATNRINDYIKNGKFFSFTEEKINAFDGVDDSHEHVEPRIRKDDLTLALSMKVFDPLWMLSRQWQMGEFRGNNAGTAISVKCIVKQEDCSTDPIEPVTEQMNPTIDLMVRVESAMHYLDMRDDPKYGATPEEASETIDALCNKYGIKDIEWEGNDGLILDCDDTRTAEKELNTQRISFANTFRNKAFDGYRLYSERKDNTTLFNAYKEWFKKQYLPAGQNDNCHWNDQALNYSIDITAGSRHFIGDRYQGGRLSWYTVDDDGSVNGNTKPESETIASLPTLARYPGAPNKRLWQFEDHAVFMGNSTEQQTKANEMFLKFATLYSNDWMLIPLKTAIGKYITVTSIEVKDTFGITHIISNRVGELFTNSKNEKTNGNAKIEPGNGLFFAPQLAATIEGKPVEEVELLRDEMANMVWGMEKTLSDGCGFTLDEQLKAVQLKTIIDNLCEKYKKQPEPGKVSFNENTNHNVRVLVLCDPGVAHEALDAGADYAGLDEYIQKIKDGWADFDVLITPPNLMPKVGALGRFLGPLGLMPSPKAGTIRMDIATAVHEVKTRNNVKVERKDAAESDYRYTLQTHVPFNWIPFVPQHIKDDKDKFGNHFDLWGREIILRRGKMPCHILTKNGYVRIPVLPVTSILRKGLDGTYQPLFINEEEVQQTGIRLIKNYQRARWLNGKTYIWLGMYKRLAKFSETSGLEFDTLHKKQ